MLPRAHLGHLLLCPLWACVTPEGAVSEVRCSGDASCDNALSEAPSIRLAPDAMHVRRFGAIEVLATLTNAREDVTLTLEGAPPSVHIEPSDALVRRGAPPIARFFLSVGGTAPLGDATISVAARGASTSLAAPLTLSIQGEAGTPRRADQAPLRVVGLAVAADNALINILDNGSLRWSNLLNPSGEVTSFVSPSFVGPAQVGAQVDGKVLQTIQTPMAGEKGIRTKRLVKETGALDPLWTSPPVNPTAEEDVPLAVGTTPDGQIAVVGRGARDEAWVVRLASDGGLISDFGRSGIWTGEADGATRYAVVTSAGEVATAGDRRVFLRGLTGELRHAWELPGAIRGLAADYEGGIVVGFVDKDTQQFSVKHWRTSGEEVGTFYRSSIPPSVDALMAAAPNGDLLVAWKQGDTQEVLEGHDPFGRVTFRRLYSGNIKGPCPCSVDFLVVRPDGEAVMLWNSTTYHGTVWLYP